MLPSAAFGRRLELPIRGFDAEEQAIPAMLDHGVSDADLAAMLRNLADILRKRGDHIGARVAEMAAERLTADDRPS